jgi:hypothetical protein
MFGNGGILVLVLSSFPGVTCRHYAGDTALQSDSAIYSSLGIHLTGFSSKIPLSALPFSFKDLVFLKVT